MKVETRQLAAFLRNPGKTRLVLLHGEDDGLIRERAKVLTRLVAGSLNDPFLVTELTREVWNSIPAEMAALSMIGGRRVVLVRDATESVLSPVLAAMKGPGQALVILEAVGLGRGKLRSFVEASAEAAAVACYPEEGQALEATIGQMFVALSVQVDPDAVTWLARNLGGDRAVIRNEVDKLALLAGTQTRVDVDMAIACTGPGSSAGDDGLIAASLGDSARCDAAVEAALLDGLSGVGLIRMAITHLQKLHQARLRMEQGQSAAEAVRAMRPPVFYRAASSWAAALGLWSADRLLGVLSAAYQTELACKQTGAQPDLLARHFLQTVARGVKSRSGRLA